MSDYQFNPSVEQWKVIPDFPGYEVSDHGRVRSFLLTKGKGKGCGKGTISTLANSPQRILTPMNNKNKYLRICLFNNKERFYVSIHRLVLMVFIGTCPDKHECCHTDGNRANNSLDNLRWDTKSANAIDRFNHGNQRGFQQGILHPLSKLTETMIYEIRHLYSKGYLQDVIATMFNVNQNTISRIVNHKRWPHL